MPGIGIDPEHPPAEEEREGYREWSNGMEVFILRLKKPFWVDFSMVAGIIACPTCSGGLRTGLPLDCCKPRGHCRPISLIILKIS